MFWFIPGQYNFFFTVIDKSVWSGGSHLAHVTIEHLKCGYAWIFNFNQFHSNSDMWLVAAILNSAAPDIYIQKQI